MKVPMTPSGIEPGTLRLVESLVRADGRVAYRILWKCVSMRAHVSFTALLYFLSPVFFGHSCVVT